MSKETISRERLEAPPGTIYAETILEPSHLFMLEHYFSPLASTNKAWTVMLVETGIVDEDRGALFPRREQVLPQRGHGLRPQLAHQTRLPAAAGVDDGAHGPRFGPQR
jgi:hypothetical protein